MNRLLSLLAICFTLTTATLVAQDGANIKDYDDYIDLIYSTSEESAAILKDTLQGWHFRWVGGFNGSQASYRNWSQGGVNTISVTGSSLFNLKYHKKRFAYNLSTNLKYGKARIDGEGTRKTDDKIGISNKFSYLFEDSRFNAFGVINFSTQFDKGFQYGEDPEKELVSNFLAPAYAIQVTGLGFKPVDYFTAEAGLALKQTIVNDTTLSTRYGLDPGETFRFEPGYSVLLNLEKTIVSNVTLISSIETFTNLQQHVKSTDVQFTNELVGKINDYMNMSFQFVLVYDEDFSTEVQLKQVLSVGFSFSIL